MFGAPNPAAKKLPIGEHSRTGEKWGWYEQRDGDTPTTAAKKLEKNDADDSSAKLRPGLRCRDLSGRRDAGAIRDASAAKTVWTASGAICGSATAGFGQFVVDEPLAEDELKVWGKELDKVVPCAKPGAATGAAAGAATGAM